jgi:hypothetical protein
LTKAFLGVNTGGGRCLAGAVPTEFKQGLYK